MTETIECAVIETMETGMVCIYRPTLTRGKTLEGLQMHVGGYVECFDVAHPQTGAIATLWFHDEGKVLGMPRNDYAMILAIVGGWQGVSAGDWIAGNVVMTGFDPESGETTPLPSEWMELIARLA